MKKGIPFALRTETPADIADFVNNNFREIFEERVGGYTLEELDDRYLNDNAVVQVVHTQTGTLATGTTLIPIDNTIPQITEGDEYMTLAITPKNANNILVIDVGATGASSAVATPIMALFQNTEANAIAVTWQVASTGGEQMQLRHKMIAGTTNNILFHVRIGLGSSGTYSFNGSGGNAYMGGKMSSYITITEYST